MKPLITKFFSYPKVNLFLKITNFNDDAQKHNINSVFLLSKQFHDVIKIILNSSQPGIFYYNLKNPVFVKKDLVDQVLFFLNENYHKNIKNLRIEITKNIPIGSGLGGGSSNAAVILKWYYQHFKIAKKDQLNFYQIAKLIGSDIPFFLSGYDVAIVKGIGDIITPINWTKTNHNIIINNVCCETNKVFAIYKNNPKFHNLNVWNDLMYPAFEIYPELKLIYDKLVVSNKKIILSGSGSSFVDFKGLEYE